MIDHRREVLRFLLLEGPSSWRRLRDDLRVSPAYLTVALRLLRRDRLVCVKAPTRAKTRCYLTADGRRVAIELMRADEYQGV